MNLGSLTLSAYPRYVSLSKTLNRALFTLLATALFYGVFIAFRLIAMQGDISTFIVAGSRFARVGPAAGVSVLPDSDGYDGQFYYRLALEPFTDRQMKYGVAMDDPRYRQQRILYPLVVSLLSFGNRGAVPLSLVLVNFISIIVMGYLGGLYAQQHSRHALYGLIFPIYAGFFLSLSRDLAEVLEVTFVLAALLCVSKGKHLPAAVLISLAILSKETALLVAVGILVQYLFSRSESRPKWYVFAVPIGVYIAWQAWLNAHWGRSVAGAVHNNIGVPFAGILEFLRALAPSTGVFDRLYLIEVIAILLTAVLVLITLRSSAAGLGVKASWLLYGALVFSLTRSVWVEDWAFLRALSEFYVLGMAILIASSLPLRRWAAGLWGGLSLWVELLKAPIP